MTDGDRKSLQQSLRDTWMSALGVISGAEAEVARAASRLFESLGLREGGEAAHTPTEAARDAARELLDRVKQNRDVLEQRVQEGVRAAVARVHKPIERELALVRGRIEALQRRVEELARKKNGPQGPSH